MPETNSCLIPYGRGLHSVRLPEGASVCRIEPAFPPPRANAGAIIRDALDNPIGSPTLRELAKGKRTAVILVPGKDRVAAISDALPALLNELNAGGIPDEGISVVLATGSHVKHSPADVLQILGEDAARRVPWRQHVCGPGAHLEFLGSTQRGTPVELDRQSIRADLRVLTGRILPHYFAGFGGGRKALVPGIASFKTILANHRLTLASKAGIHPRVSTCSLAGNPVHLDMVEAARMAGPAFVFNTLLDTQHRLVHAVAGELEAAHLAGCRQAEAWHQVELPEAVDAVVTSAGGWPYDCDFVQALKAIFNISGIVRSGGSVLWMAQCHEGMKESFLKWAGIRSQAELERAARENYNLSAHNTILLRRLTGRARVALWSDLPDDAVRALGLEPVHTPEHGMAWLGDACRRGGRCAVAPCGNITFATAPNQPTGT